MAKFLGLIGATASQRASLVNKQLLAMLLFSSANAAINPYKNIFGVKVIGLPEALYSLVILLSGVVITILSVYFGKKSDEHGGFVKYILICSGFGFLGNISVFALPNTYTYFFATCLSLPIFCALNSLIFGYAAARRHVDQARDSSQANAALRAAYSLGYVVTLGAIGVLSLQRDELIYIWLFAGMAASFIFALYFREKSVNKDFKSVHSSEPIAKIFNKQNVIKLLSVSLITNMLFTLDATAPFVIINQAHGGYSNIGVFEAGIAAFEIVFIFIWAGVAQKKKASKAIIAGALIFALAIGLFSASHNVIHVYMLIPLLALGAACLISVPIGYLQSLAEERPGVGGSLLSISFFVSSSVSSAVYFLGNHFFGAVGTIFISIVVGLFGLATLLILEERKTL